MPKKPKGSQGSDTSSSSNTGGSSSAFVLADILDFLDKRHLDVPAALRKACPVRPPIEQRTNVGGGNGLLAAETAEFKWALTLLAGLKERERRALARFVEKRATSSNASSSSQSLTTSSDLSYGASDGEDDGANGSEGPPVVRGGSWPEGVRFTNDYCWGEDVPPELRAQYRPEHVRKRPARPCARTFSAAITDPDHPAFGQCGLFARRPLPHGAWVIDYVGAVSLGANEDKTSDYVCDFGEHSELALDAKTVGNEARFVNDYRNTGRRANVEFRLRRDAAGEMRQGVFICAKEGVGEGEELLISYGKSYWTARVGCMEEFITRRPGEAAPPRRI